MEQVLFEKEGLIDRRSSWEAGCRRICSRKAYTE